MLHPFYLFQLGSVILWYVELYYFYATTIAVMSICSITWTIFFTRKNLHKLRSIHLRI